MEIRYSKQVTKHIRKLAPKKQKQLIGAINNLPKGDVSNLINIDGYRLRVGGLRVLFDMDDSNIMIKAIAPRGKAYK